MAASVIVVLGPAELSDAVAGAFAGELVIGAREDRRLAGEPAGAVLAAGALPIPARLCVVPSGRPAPELCAKVAGAGGAVEASTTAVVGAAPPGTTAAAWRALLEPAGALAVSDVVELAARLPAPPSVSAPSGLAGPSPATVRDPAVWRDTLRARRRRRGGSTAHRADRRVGEQQLDVTIRRGLGGSCHTVAVISPKGGVGKTLLSFLLGSVLATVRDDRVVVVDANPDFGSLADLVPCRGPATIADLLRSLPQVTSRQRLEAMVTSTVTGMDVLPAPRDPAEMSRLGGHGYAAVDELLRRHYDLVVYDCGTGFLDEVTQFALRTADHVVLVCAPQLVTARVVLGAAAHLRRTRFDLRRATLALNMTAPGGDLDLDRIHAAVDRSIGGIVEVPHDERLQRDLDLGEFRYDRLRGTTRLALKRLAAEVVGRIPAGLTVELTGTATGGVLSAAEQR